MRLSEQEFWNIKYYIEHNSGLNKQDLINMKDTIEDLQQENAQLKARLIAGVIDSDLVKTYDGSALERADQYIGKLQQENEQLRAELSQWAGLGDKAVTELVHERLHVIPQLRQTIQQLQAQVARMTSNLCLLCVGCETEPENGTTECNSFVCRNKKRCHNPADVEALKQAREVLYKLRMDDYPGFSAICEALAEIDKAIGGGEK